MSIKSKGKLIAAVLAVIAVFALLIWLHIFWWTMLALLVLIVVLLHFSVTVKLKASRADGIDIRAKWLFLTLYPWGKKSAPEQEHAPPAVIDDDSIFDDLDDLEDDFDDEPAAPEEVSEDTAAPDEEDKPEEESSEDEKIEEKEDKPEPAADEPEKKKSGGGLKGKIASIKAKFEKIKPYIPIAWKAVRKFMKAIRFEDVDLWAEVGRFDAHEAAIYYGAVQKLVFGTLEKIGLLFTLKVKRADVRCCFCENKIDGGIEMTVRVRPSAMIAIAFCTGVKFLITFLRQRKKRKKAGKAAAAA